MPVLPHLRQHFYRRLADSEYALQWQALTRLVTFLTLLIDPVRDRPLQTSPEVQECCSGIQIREPSKSWLKSVIGLKVASER